MQNCAFAFKKINFFLKNEPKVMISIGQHLNTRGTPEVCSGRPLMKLFEDERFKKCNRRIFF